MIRRSARRRDDTGFSLIEVLVGSSIMAVVAGIAAQCFLTMYQTSGRTEAAATAQSQLDASFAKLDREVRYAYRINDAYAADRSIDGTTQPAFAVTYVIPDADNRNICVELALPQAGGTLMRTQWVRTPAAGETSSLSATAVATSLVSGNLSKDALPQPLNPFTRKTYGDATSNFDRLALQVNSTVGLAEKNSVREYNLSFTALNTQGSATDLSCTRPS